VICAPWSSRERQDGRAADGTLGAPLNDIARHPVRGAAGARSGGRSTRSEAAAAARSIVQEHYPYENPITKVWRGDEAEKAADCLEREAPVWIAELDYRFYPGPNSNTFGDVMLRECDLHASLPSTSVGKDWRGVIGGGVTSEGTGLQLETPIIGFKIGLKEGVELHFLGLSFGIDLWPPAIILPLGPGRLGFADR
jgi:hypothetical protein